ncbi:amidase [Coraliomargarita parva]|uniref:amidase n=1 Tax=Coraliomargarita parva TaxID=3014050 RepID=UPI0022B56185|nr:amidase family protein [Coraliomargarita parva]
MNEPPRSLDEWRELAKHDAQSWAEAVRSVVAACIEKTDTSVVSADLSASAVAGGGALAGVPYALKDLFNIRGWPTHNSSLMPDLVDHPVTDDSELVLELRRLGASCVMKTQMNEFAYGLSGENPHYGDCPHPSRPDCLSGGSSSGSAYVVGAGYLPLAFGTDTGGSIRVPSALCGIYGIRWVPGYCMGGAYPLAESFDTIGWFTRTAEDMRSVLEAWFDGGEAAFGRLRGSLLIPSGLVDAESEEVLTRAAAGLGLGEPGDAAGLLSLMPDSNKAFNVLQSREAYALHKERIRYYKDYYDPAVLARIQRGALWSGEDIESAEGLRMRLAAWFEHYFSDYDFLALPVCPGAAVPPSAATPDLREKTLRLTSPASLAQLPALTVPLMLDEKRSIGIQFIFREVSASVPLALLELCKTL